MADIPAAAIPAFAAAVAILLYAVAWRFTRTSSPALKLLARAVLPIVVFIPIILFATLNFEAERGAGSAPPSMSAPAPGAGAPAEAEKSEEGTARRYEMQREDAEKEMEEAKRQYEKQMEDAAGAMKPGAPAPSDETKQRSPDTGTGLDGFASKKAKPNGEGAVEQPDDGLSADDASPPAGGAAPPETVGQPAPPPQPLPAPAEAPPA